MLFVTGIVLLALTSSVPFVLAGLERAQTRAAAQFLAGQMNLARMEAAMRSAAVAFRFGSSADGVDVQLFVDGNRNGIREVEIADGTDWPLHPPSRLEHRFPGVVIGAPATSGDQAVALGGTNILTFTAAGTATSGTIHVVGREGTRYAVRVLGTTARVRVLRFDPSTGRWIDTL